MALTDLTRISTSGIATGSTIDAAILRKDVSFRGSQVGVTSSLFDSSDDALEFNDNVKLKFGNSGNLQLYYDNSSYITNGTAGHLFIKTLNGGSDIRLESNDDIFLMTAAGLRNSIICRDYAQVELYHNNLKKFETTQTGAIVTGILTATGFSGPLSNASGISTFYDLRVTNNLTVEGTTSTLDTTLIGVDRVEVGANSNSIVGVAVTQSGTADLVNLFDGATKVVTVDDQGNVGLGSAIPSAKLDVNGTSQFSDIATFNKIGDSISMADSLVHTGNNGTKLQFHTNVAELHTSGLQRLQINSGGNIIFKSPNNNTGEQPASLKWINENNAGDMGKISLIREAVSQAPAALAFYTSPNVDTSANSGRGDITERLRINSSGQVSLGNNPTVASDAALHIELDGSREYLRLNADAGNNNAYIEIQADDNRRKALIFKSGGTRRGVIGVGDSDEAANATSLFFSASSNIAGNSPHMVITSDGKFGFGGETSPEYKVTVYDAGYSGVTIKTNRNTATDNIGGLHFKTRTTNVAYIQSLVDGTIKFRNSSSLDEKVRIKPTGELLVGTTNLINTSPSKFQVASNDATGSAILARFNASVYSSYLDFYKSRSNTLGTAYVVNDDDHLGAIRYYAADGSNSGYTTAAEIYGSCDGGSGAAGDMPGRITFHTRPDGAGQSMQERLRISSDGQIAANYVAHHTSSSGVIAAYAPVTGRFAYKAIEIGDTVSSGSDTGGIIAARRKAASSVPFVVASSYDNGTLATLYYGGGWGSHGGNATNLRFFTGAYSTGNSSGSERLGIDKDGQIYINNRTANNVSHKGSIVAYAPSSGIFAYKSLEIGSTNATSSDTGGLIVAQRKGTSAYPFALLGSWDNGSACTVYIGGGWGSQSANATQLNFYTSGNQSSGGSSGHVRLSIDTNGEAIFYKNVAVGGGHPWSVTGGNYNNLSISGNDASSSGFLNLGNGAATNNADFDLSRIKIHNGATEVARITGTTATSDNGDAHLKFFTKKAGAGLKEVLRIRNDGFIETMYEENQQSYAYNISPTPCIRARNNRPGNGIYAGIQLFNQRTSGAAAVADIGVVNDASTDYVSYLTFTTRNSDTTYSEKIRIDSGGQIRYQYANNAKHAFALRETVRTITGHSTTGYQYVRCALLNSRTAYRCAVSTQGGNYGPGVQFFTVLRSWDSTTFYVTDKLNIGSAYANAVRMQSDNSGGTFYLEVNISLSTTSQGFSMSVTPLAANSGDMTTALQFYGSGMSNLANTSSAQSL